MKIPIKKVTWTPEKVRLLKQRIQDRATWTELKDEFKKSELAIKSYCNSHYISVAGVKK